MSTSSIDGIRAASVDGRARNPRYIQNQLRRLHYEIVQNASNLRSAIQRDTGVSSAEADTEYLLALDCVKTEYSSIDVDKCLEDEYNLAKGKDFPNRREAVGIVYIKPTQYTLLYSVVVSLATAIATGNCVVLELGKTVSQVNDILRRSLTVALDAETFTVVDNPPDDQQFLDACVQVLQTGTEALQSSRKALISPSSSRVIAVVDRSTNIAEAAEALVKARFSFGGKSPYAPDLVLVNEFRVKEFSNALLQQSTQYFAQASEYVNGYANGHANGHTSGPNPPKRRQDQKSVMDIAKEDDGCNVLVSGARASIIHATSRESSILKQRINEPLLVFNSVSSLDDAIDFANESNLPLLALHVFAAPAEAKYLAQFIEASVSFVNHIPVPLLVGPAAPANHPLSPTARYTPDMFTVPRPSYVIASKHNELYGKTIESNSTQLRKEALEKAVAPLPPTGQHSGKAVGFFDQGLITGAVVFVLPVIGIVVGLTGWGLWRGVRYLRAR